MRTLLGATAVAALPQVATLQAAGRSSFPAFGDATAVPAAATFAFLDSAYRQLLKGGANQ